MWSVRTYPGWKSKINYMECCLLCAEIYRSHTTIILQIVSLKLQCQDIINCLNWRAVLTGCYHVYGQGLISIEAHAYPKPLSTISSCQLYFLPQHTAHFITAILCRHCHFGKSVPEAKNESKLLLIWLPENHTQESGREGYPLVPLIFLIQIIFLTKQAPSLKCISAMYHKINRSIS